MTAEAETATAVTPRKAQSPVLRRVKSKAFQRIGWGFADQFVSSMTNYAVSLFLVHLLDASAFGAFSLSYVTYGFVLNASRGLATDPLMSRFSDVTIQRWRAAVAACTGAALIVGIIGGLLALAAGLIIKGTAGSAFVALGLTLPGLMLQDSWRYSFFALGRGSQALLNDLVWAAVMVPALLLLKITGHSSLFLAVLAWGLSAWAAASVGSLQARVMPQVSGAWKWIRQHGDLGFRYLAEGMAGSASLQIRGYGVGILVGLSAVGYMQAANTLIGPMTILALAFPLALIPEGVRVLARGTTRLMWFCIIASVGLVGIGVIWGLIIWIGLPRGLGNVALGPIWRHTYSLMLPTMVGVIGANAKIGVGVGMHALGASKRSLNNVLLSSAVWVILSLAGAVRWGAEGAIWGTTLAIWLTLPIAWWQFHVAVREYNASASLGGRRRVRGRHRRPRRVLFAD